MSMQQHNSGDEYLIEFYRLGNAMKVSACDPRTLTEVTIVGSAHSPQSILERAAVNKLNLTLGRVKPAGRA